MAAIMSQTEVGVKKIGSKVTLPSSPTARLMHYLDCICTLLDLSDEADLATLRNFRNYNRLTEPQLDKLVLLCFLLSPDELVGKVMFQDDSLCVNKANQFLEISSVSKNLLVSESIVIGGQQRRVHKIMAFKKIWVTRNWIEPMKHFSIRLARIAALVSRRRNTGCCCTIL